MRRSAFITPRYDQSIYPGIFYSYLFAIDYIGPKRSKKHSTVTDPTVTRIRRRPLIPVYFSPVSDVIPALIP